MKTYLKVTTNSILILTFSLVLEIGAADLEVTNDPENVVGSRLEGDWEVDLELTKRLTGKEKVRGENPMDLVSFESADGVVERIPQKYKDFLSKDEVKVYMSGWMNFGDNRCPFILVSMSGNPHVFFFLKEGEDEFGNGESFNVMLAVGKGRKDDLLFIGGDFNNQPFSAYTRPEPRK
jgi:hypothetical protein